MNTADLVDMDHIDDDLARFQQDSIVKDALSKNVDLSQYSRQIDEDLRDVEADSVRGIIQEGDQVVRLLHSPHPQPCATSFASILSIMRCPTLPGSAWPQRSCHTCWKCAKSCIDTVGQYA